MSVFKSVIILVGVLLIGLIIASPIFAQGPFPNSEEPRFVPGEILVKFRPHVTELGAQRSLDAEGLHTLEVSPHSRLIRVQVPPGFENATIARLMARGDVQFATPNYYVQALGDPNDQYFSAQWSLHNSGQTGGTPDADIDAPEAWDFHTGTDNITIAIVDSGVDLDHPDLQAKIVPGFDFVNNDNDPDDDYGHGTHVAGIAAAIGDNGIGIAGVSWGAKIMPLKALDASGNGTVYTVANAIHYAVDNGAKVINMSLGARFSKWPCDMPAIETELDYAVNNNVLVIVASGNDGQLGVSCPGAYDQVMAVGSTTKNDTQSPFSNYGPRLDIAAPGSSIYSTYPNPPYYTTLSGTSMATPHVAGLAALIWSVDPSLPHSEIRNIIQDTADDLGSTGYDIFYGYGRINARRALETFIIDLQEVTGEPLTPPTVFLVDDEHEPIPASKPIQITTINPQVLTWTVTISPSVSWLSVQPPMSGLVSSSTPDQFTLVATQPITYGVYTTTVVVTGTISGVGVSAATSEVQINFVPKLHIYYFPIFFKN